MLIYSFVKHFKVLNITKYSYTVYIYNVSWPRVSALPLDKGIGRVGGEKK